MADQEQYADFGYPNQNHRIDTPNRAGSTQNIDTTVVGASIEGKEMDSSLLASMNNTKEERGTNDVVQPKPSSTNEVPNGGLKAWLQVLGAHLLFFNSWGIVNTFGAYQTYYQTDLLSTHSSSAISWIGTFQGFLLIVFGIVGGPVFDRGYFRTLMFGGTFLVVFGMMMTSLASQYWQIFLAQGLCVGLGAGALFLPSVAIVATYFSTKRALATGITAAGGSVGSVIYPIIFNRLQPTIGFGWATRIIAFIGLFTLSISIAVLRMRLPPPGKARAIFDVAAWKYPPFVVFSIGLFLAFMGLYIPFFYIIVYAESLAVDEDLSFYLLSVLNAASVFGRIIPGLLADKLGSLEVLTGTALAAAIIAYAWMAVKNLAGLIIFCIFYGFFSGAVVSLPSTVIAKLVPEMRLVGTWMGMSFSFAGLGFLIGNPIAGVILDPAAHRFNGGIAFSASTIIAGGIAFVAVKLLQQR